MPSRFHAVSLLAILASAGVQAANDGSPTASVRGPADGAHRRDARDAEDYRASFANAAKRGAADPIEIVVCGAVVPKELSAVLDARAAVEAIARELWDEPLFRVRVVHAGGPGAVGGERGCVAAASAHGFVPDVWVFATVEKDDATERIRKTGNLMADPTLTIRVEAASTFGKGRSAPSASGPVDRALSVVVDAARAARAAILDDIAPELPSRTSESHVGRKTIPSGARDRVALR